jgi:hypothetical protein
MERFNVLIEAVVVWLSSKGQERRTIYHASMDTESIDVLDQIALLCLAFGARRELAAINESTIATGEEIAGKGGHLAVLLLPFLRLSRRFLLGLLWLVQVNTLHSARRHFSAYSNNRYRAMLVFSEVIYSSQVRQETSSGKSAGRKGSWPSPSSMRLDAGLGESISIAVAITSTAVRCIPSLSVYLRCVRRPSM